MQDYEFLAKDYYTLLKSISDSREFPVPGVTDCWEDIPEHKQEVFIDAFAAMLESRDVANEDDTVTVSFFSLGDEAVVAAERAEFEYLYSSLFDQRLDAFLADSDPHARSIFKGKVDADFKKFFKKALKTFRS